MPKSSKEILVNAFTCGAASQAWSGLWSHPRSAEVDYNSIDYWRRLATTCENGLIDGIFLADSLGVADIYQSSPAAKLRSGSLVPNIDPMLVIPLMAAVTRHLTFGITGNTTFETPYLLARRFSTLDHLSNGRVAWNVVTGTNEAASRAVGLKGLPPHDERYRAAHEFMEVVYKLWEQSWDDDAVIRDRKTRVFAEPTRVRPVTHEGKYYQCQGIHLSEPSPQRTPLIFSAGSSPAGIEFLAKHAECGFISAGPKDGVRKTTAALREKAREFGRSGDDIKVYLGMTIVVAQTDAEAKDLLEEYASYADLHGMLAFKSGYIGVDLSKYGLEDPLPNQKTNASQSALAQYSSWRIRDLGTFQPMEGREVFLVGSKSRVCDEIQSWVDETGIDGINLLRTVEPEGLQAFCRLVVPELQDRGAYKTAYRPGTMREKVLGFPSGLAAASHPAGMARQGR
jgi:FMN-dependent oxidoreductase (nitrilotriacetate monooxygenase family)